MKRSQSKPSSQAGVGLAVITTVCTLLATVSLPAAEPAAAKAAEPAAKAEQKPAPKKLSGAELYAINCNRCHPERYPTEWTATQWKTIMLQMRVRANLPAEQSKAILKYLQEDSGK